MKTSNKKCHFCNIELNSLITYDIRHAFRRWADGKFDNTNNNSFQLFIPSINKSSCIDHYLIHTGQNYDHNLNEIFLSLLINPISSNLKLWFIMKYPH